MAYCGDWVSSRELRRDDGLGTLEKKPERHEGRKGGLVRKFLASCSAIKKSEITSWVSKRLKVMTGPSDPAALSPSLPFHRERERAGKERLSLSPRERKGRGKVCAWTCSQPFLRRHALPRW